MDKSEITKKLEKNIESLQQQLRTLRVGRASAALVEDIEVEVYGAKTPLKQVASISIPQHNQIMIQPWDPSNLGAVQSAILKSDIGINPVAEGNAIRLTLPPLTEERRKQLAIETHKYGEEARISVRNTREEAMRHLDSAEEKKEISEDDKFRYREELQKMIDDYNKSINEAIERKEKEIMEQ
ncbi:MAG: ribosome recycling factor [Candidatus Spechtbacteria bacterium RIFCSPLOWO2_01_FULL_43_12]|uniref:Ribosome-recycling factor n=1 Tax=Candidatus Spechtbacteria bacterium RIFCSPLOWO2_01_FULL_43_12 TaxID=1802162 RepID=A0A1G2HF50_9BACT|nr:MAG: ribosome recycling factor [Candidatus Spechtbacteria bacterium RIFCSPLOWO2_01_FULL_43_12]